MAQNVVRHAWSEILLVRQGIGAQQQGLWRTLVRGERRVKSNEADTHQQRSLLWSLGLHPLRILKVCWTEPQGHPPRVERWVYRHLLHSSVAEGCSWGINSLTPLAYPRVD